MKNRFLLLVNSLLMISSLASCNTNINNDKTALDYGSLCLNSEEPLELINKTDTDNDRLLDFFTHKEDGETIKSYKSAIIAFYFTNGCACWTATKGLLKQFALKYNVLIYYYNATGVDAKDVAYSVNIKNVNNDPLYAIIKKGKLEYVDRFNSEKSRFSDFKIFEQHLLTKIELPRMFYVSKEQLDAMYNSTNNFVIYFAWSSCSDCKYTNDHFLYDYMAKTNKKMYVLDCDVDGIRFDDKGNVDNEQYTAFKQAYGLSSDTNPTFGYETGFVPTFFYVEPNGNKITSIKSGIVVQNDKINDENIVTRTYFTNERKDNLDYIDGIEVSVLEGVQLKEGEKLGYLEQKEEFAKYHNPLLKSFLDLHL